MAQVTYYHDFRKPRADGSAPIKLLVTFRGGRVLISTDVFLTEAQWNPMSLTVTGHPLHRQLNTFLQKRRLDAERVMLELAIRSVTLNPALVRRCIETGTTETRVPFLSKYREVMRDPALKPRTQELYELTLRKLLKWADETGDDPEGWYFEDITRGWVSRFDRWLSIASPSKNARNIHLRNIRHVCNVAVTDHLTDFYDFRAVSLKGTPTAKRSLKVEQLRAFLSLDVEPFQRQYLDMFRLIFCLIGINTVDLCHLRKTDIRDGRLEYTRAKTGHKYSIKIEPEAEEIISRYAGEGDWLLNILDRYTNFKDFAHRLNENLQKMGSVKVGKHGKKDREPLFPSLTTYWARHSWATIAASLDIPYETISAALGHGYGNRITAIYIDFDMRKVDDANRKVMDWVLYNKK